MSAGGQDPRHVDRGSALPAEAHAAALAGLPGMGPARLAAVCAVMTPLAAWSCLAASQGASSPTNAVLRRVLGPAGEQLLPGWHELARRVEVEQVWQQISSLEMGVALHGHPGYPRALVDDVEPPTLLFHRGALEALHRPRVAVVGTRRCTSAGAGIAFELGRDLAGEGIAVVSGLASGIDAAAHRGSLQAGAAVPVGVVATGMDVVYPPQQQELWRQVCDTGLLLSEAPPGTRPERWRFPARNRIIAALADVVVVVESHQRGGALHTVDEADRRSVPVMGVPGSLRSSASVGTNNLLAEGRAPVRDASDVLIALSLDTCRRVDRPTEQRVPPRTEDARVLDAMTWQPSNLDQLMLRTGRDLPALVAALSRLEDAGWVACRGGWCERVADGWEPVP